ncbi:MAG: restriction endonuclease [Phycisphaeraceae bacterium]|nr:restriction endonuclease [Phycisphaeraceae bacterium]
MGRSRRTESGFVDVLFDLLLVVPIWVGPALAAVVFVLLRWVVPAALGGSVGAQNMTSSAVGTLSMFAFNCAPWAGAAVLLIWVGAEIKKRLNGRRLEMQTGAGSIRNQSWQEFEALLSEAFRRQGFGVDHTGGARPDGGIDLRLNKAGAVTLVQCKHWKTRQVRVGVVRELRGVVASERAQSGIVVTSGTFTPDAVEFAARNPIRLIAGEELVAMIAEVQKSGRIASVADAPASGTPRPAAAVTPNTPEIRCPECGAAMVQRVAKRGPNAGSAFMGCTRYPQCRGRRAASP